MGRCLRYESTVTPEDDTCCWPGCERESDVEVPVCEQHLNIVWGLVENRRAPAMWAASERRRVETSERIKARPSVVYFIRLGNRIKIGHTTNLRLRLAILPHEEVLLTLPGGRLDEQRCHAAFEHLRTGQRSEWFRAEPELLRFIEDLRPAEVHSA